MTRPSGRGGITGRTGCDGAAARRVRELRDRARHAAYLAGAAGEGAPHDRTVVLPRSVRPALVYRGDADGRRAASAHGVADGHVVARRRGRPRRQPWRGSRASPWRRERHDVRPRDCARRANAHRQHGTAEWRAALDRVARSRPTRRALVSTCEARTRARAERRDRASVFRPARRRRIALHITFPIWPEPICRCIEASASRYRCGPTSNMPCSSCPVIAHSMGSRSESESSTTWACNALTHPSQVTAVRVCC